MHIDCDPGLFKKPVGKEGRSLLENMNDHHRSLSEWALSVLPDVKCDKILDIGCGGGMLISLLAQRFPGADIFGIDISEESVTLTKETNRDLVEKGKCRISLGSVSEMPFEEGSFDLVTAFETYFFWPDLDNDVRKAALTVRNGGHLIIVSETYPHPDFRERNDEAIRLCGLNILENGAMKEMMERCGLNVTVNVIEEKNWVAFVGRKV